MKSVAMLLVLSLSCPAVFAQAKPPEAAKAAEPAKAAPQEPVKAAEPAKRAKPAMSAKKSRRSEDARACLDKTSNNEIIKCAEEYL
jgi:hypothetical protein